MANRKEDTIALLASEIKELKRQISGLKTANILAAKEPLARLWDNKYDDQWNNC